MSRTFLLCIENGRFKRMTRCLEIKRTSVSQSTIEILTFVLTRPCSLVSPLPLCSTVILMKEVLVDTIRDRKLQYSHLFINIL